MFQSSFNKRLHMKIEDNWPRGFRGGRSKMWTVDGGRRTDDDGCRTPDDKWSQQRILSIAQVSLKGNFAFYASLQYSYHKNKPCNFFCVCASVKAQQGLIDERVTCSKIALLHNCTVQISTCDTHCTNLYNLVHCLCPVASLRKHAYSNILKILQPKKENFQIKNSDIFHTSAQNIDCGYSLEPPRWGGSNENPQSMIF